MPIFSAEALNRTAQTILAGLGTPADIAEIVASSLVEANLVGHDSHGVMRLTSYARWVDEGLIKPAARPEVISQHQATARIDGHWCWGQLGASFTAQKAIELAREFGVAVATLTHCVHTGRIGQWITMIAEAGMIGMAAANHVPAVAPFGGRRPVAGTNPLSWAAPRAEDAGGPLLVDFATAATAEGKLQVARAKGETVPFGLIVDKAGRPTQNPHDFYDGGALLPFGGHKGYGYNLMVEVLAGALGGTGPSLLPGFDWSNNIFMLAVNVAAFEPLEQFIEQIEAFCAAIKATPPAEGFSEVLVPGEPEIRASRQRETEGIPVPEKTWEEIQDLAKKLNVVVYGREIDL
jgi:uncharacterized oxidoreductase